MWSMLILGGLLTVPTLVVPAQEAGQPPLQAVRVQGPALAGLLQDARAYATLLSERTGPFADMLVTPDQKRRLAALDVSWRDLRPGEWRDPAAAAARALPPYSNYTFGMLQADLTTLAAAHPDRAALSVLGLGHDGNPIYLMKVSDQVDQAEDEPRVFFMGQHHAGEAVGVDCCLRILHYLLDGYGSDPEATAHVDGLEIYVVPMANPDGWDLLETGALSSWRKNTRDNNGDGSFQPGADGVDLNRNFSFRWGNVGSSSPSSDVYYGPSPLSEPEDQAIAALAASARFALTLTFHMSGEVIILPWTWQGQHTPDHPTYSGIGATLASRIPSLWSGSYGWFTDSSSGGYLDDHLYGWHGTLCYTVEVSTINNTAAIQQVADNNLLGARYILERAQVGQITGRVTNARTGEPVSATVRVREVDTSSLPARTSDPLFGRYRWILADGAYTLQVSSGQGYAPYEQGGLTASGASATVHDVALQPLEAWIGGTPVTGQPLTFHLDGQAGDDYILVLSPGQGSTPFPPYGGTLLLDLAGLFVLGVGALDPAGSVSIPVTIPDHAPLVGLEYHFQALTGPSIAGKQAHFTNAASILIQ